MFRAQYVAVLLACLSALSACRINRGGSGAIAIDDDFVDAARPVAAPMQAHDAPASVADSSMHGPVASSGDTDASDPAPPTAGAGSMTDATLDAGSPPRAADADGCGKTLQIEVCNPISNTGCAAELGMQCDVDLLAEKLSGQYVFSAPNPDAGTCLNIPPTETCPAGHTCVDFSECKKLCGCDSDCDAGDCCSDRLGDHGFKTCSRC